MSRSVEKGKTSRQPWVICGGLLLITLAVYWPVLSCDFVNYDDPDYVTSNTHVQSGLTWANIGWAFTTGHASNWHPLTWLSHSLDCQTHGLNPGGHHLTNLLFHLANTLLLFALLRCMTSALWPSALVAALFAWHPMHVESVAWISERKDVLSAFFWLLTMLAYTLYAIDSRREAPRAKVWYGVALLAFALGLLSKPMLVTLPFALLLLDYWPLCRNAACRAEAERRRESGLSRRSPAKAEVRLASPKLQSEGGSSESRRRGQVSFVSWKFLVLEKAPFLVLAAASSVVTFTVQRKGGSVSSLDTLSVGARLANALVSYLRYAGKLFWPENLAVLYPHPGHWPAALVAAAGLFVAAVSAWAVWRPRREPYLAVGWFWFVGTLVPVIGIVQVGVQSMADRYTYVPAIGIFIMIAWGASELLRRWPQGQSVLVAGGVAALAGCLVATSWQLQYWKNSEALFRHAVKVTDKNYLAYNNLGFFLSNQGKMDEAMENYQKSLEINPGYQDAQNNMGHALAAKGRYAEAIGHYEAALSINPNLVEAHNNLGNALSDTGRLDEAIAHYLKALQLRPEDEDAHNNLGVARAMQGRLDEAAQILAEAVRLKPADASAHSNFGNVLAAQNKLNEAAAEYEVSLRLDPQNAQAHNNLGNVRMEQGRLGEAGEHYRLALKLNANNPEANQNLGLALVRQGKREEALGHFREALRLRPNYPEARRQLEALARGAAP